MAAVGVITESYSGFVCGCKSAENVRMDSLFRQCAIYTAAITPRLNIGGGGGGGKLPNIHALAAT